MDSVLAGILTVPFDFPIQIRDGKGIGQLQPAIGFNPRDDVLGRRVHIRASAMVRELELLTVGRDRCHDGLGRRLAQSA